MRKVLALAIAAVFLAALPARAATTHVHVESFAFSPSTISVTTGDSVQWDNHDGFDHTVTSDTGAFNAVLASGGQSTVTFNGGGTYPYHCAFHPGMKGSITVTGPPIAPSAPRSPAAAPGTSLGSVAVAWQAPLTPGVASYRIYRGTSAGTLALHGTTTSTTFTDTATTPLTTYHYAISAINAGGESPRTAVVCSKPFPWLALLGC